MRQKEKRYDEAAREIKRTEREIEIENSQEKQRVRDCESERYRKRK